MNIKQYKKDLEDRVVKSIKAMVNEGVEVNAMYDMDKETISVLLFEEHKKDDVRESIVVYSCTLNTENNALSVAGFVRRYGYDAFGIAQIVNDPISVDDNFMNGIKGGILMGMQEPAEAPEVEAEAIQEPEVVTE